MTTPPAASSRSAAALQLAASQRARVRQRISALESQVPGAAAAGASAAIRHEYRTVLNGFSARLHPSTIKALKADPDVARIVPDGTVKANLDVSVPLVRAPEAWSALGYRGAGVRIAVIDTGVDYRHPDLGGCLGAGCKVVGGYDFVNNDGDPVDDQGHGTHVAATAAGNGRFLGVAPDAQILAYKVLDSFGSGTFSGVIAGIERAADPNGDGNPADRADVISMSLGGPGDENDPVSTAVDNATAVGVLSVVAAGNAGADYFTIGSPGTARSALTVGATDDFDQIAYFSSRGPTPVERLVKPEITAPGVSICAATIPGAFPGEECGDATHASISGTSMATPHVSGAAAILRGVYPGLSPAQIKAMLQHSAVPLGLDAVTGGSGRLDVRAALDVGTVLSPASLSLGVHGSPTSSWTRSASVTIRNLDATSKTYALTTERTALPGDVSFTVSPAAVTLGAAASATVTVTMSATAATPATATPPFVHQGTLVATGGGDRAEALVTFSRITPPANDSCDAAEFVTTTSFTDDTTTTDATVEPTDPTASCACSANTHTVWYAFTAQEDGVVTADTFGSNYDTVLSVYSGSCGSLSPVTCNDDASGVQSRVSFDATAGTTYFVEVASYCASPGGSLTFSLRTAGSPGTISDPFTEVFSDLDFDLDHRTLSFVPSGTSYSVCSQAASTLPVDPAGGSVLALGDDSAIEVVLTGGQTIALHGQRYGSAFVGSNGYLTFGTPDSSYSASPENHFALPRIAALLTDMNPAAGGTVSWQQLTDRVAITYAGVPSYGTANTNTFQLELFFAGTIRITYLEMQSTSGIAGPSRGQGVPVDFRESDLSAAGSCEAPGTPAELLAGRSLQLSDSLSRPQARQVKVAFQQEDGPAMPAPGSDGDPTLHGATFQILNPTSRELDTLNLPAAGWTAVGSPVGSGGYRYRDRDRLLGPCTTARLSPGQPVQVSCSGTGVGFTLDEAQQGSLAVSLTAGSGEDQMRYCTVFGGRIVKDQPATATARGMFKATNAVAPAGCPIN